MKQDSIRFTVSAEEVVVNTTVKITAAIVAMVTPDRTEQKLKDDMRELMQQFISVADWQFAGMTRTSHASGMEQVNLTATARVPESENYALGRRKDEVSRDGLRIHAVSTDTSPTLLQIDATQSKLRQTLLQKAQAEMAAINTTLAAEYHIGKVIFDPVVDSMASNQRGNFAMAASYGSGFTADAGGGASDIGNAVKLSMQALITLRA